MIQKAEHSYDRDYHDNFANSKTSNVWIGAAMAALALLAVGVWYASGPATVGSQGTSKATATEEIAPVPAPAEAPAPAELAPAQQPAQPQQ
jgi:hypothetical protein